MTNQESLEKVIQRAIDGGFTENDMGQEIKTVQDVYYYFDDDHGNLSVNNLIWRHDFAKALWGEDGDIEQSFTTHNWISELHKSFKNKATYLNIKPWQYHLQQMVIADDPIEYLKDNM